MYIYTVQGVVLFGIFFLVAASIGLSWNALSCICLSSTPTPPTLRSLKDACGRGIVVVHWPGPSHGAHSFFPGGLQCLGSTLVY